MPMRDMPENFYARNLREAKTYLPKDLADNCVLLRMKTADDEFWFRMAPSDFVALANFLADDAAKISRGH
jgi:hypothetical protein